jgi:hypothetical protein
MQHTDNDQGDARNDNAAPAPQAPRLLAPGIAFLGCGVTFLGTGIISHLLVFMSMAPAFIALGVVFIALDRKRQQASRKD